MELNKDALANIRTEADAIRRRRDTDQHIDALATMMVNLIDALDSGIADYVERRRG